MKPTSPNRLRRKWLAFAACATVVLLFALPRLLDRQPRYQGRTVESWLAQVMDFKRGHFEARTALKAMGRDAVPCEIKVLARHDSKWRRNLRTIRAKAPSFLARMLPDSGRPDELRMAASLALSDNSHLGEFAPQIVGLLNHSDPTVRTSAMQLVANSETGLQRLAIPAICNGLKDPNPSIRLSAASTLGQIGTTPREAVPDLERALGDAEIEVRLWAAHALLRIGATNLVGAPLKQLLNEIRPQTAQGQLTHVTNR